MKKWIFVLFSFAIISAHAGVIMIAEESSGSIITTIFMEGENVCIDTDDGDRLTIQFDGLKKLIRIINHGDRSYMEIDQQSMKQMTQAINQAMSQMEETFKSMPPEQRAMMERMMGGMMPKKQAPPKLELKATGEKKTIDGKSSRRHNMLKDGTLQAEYWVASYKELGIQEEDVRAMHAMSEMQQEILGAAKNNPMAQNIDFSALAFQQMNGLPLVTRVYQDGRVISETFLRQVKPGKVPPAKFLPPQGYQQKEMPQMPEQPTGLEMPKNRGFTIPRF